MLATVLLFKRHHDEKPDRPKYSTFFVAGLVSKDDSANSSGVDASIISTHSTLRSALDASDTITGDETYHSWLTSEKIGYHDNYMAMSTGQSKMIVIIRIQAGVDVPTSDKILNMIVERPVHLYCAKVPVLGEGCEPTTSSRWSNGAGRWSNGAAPQISSVSGLTVEHLVDTSTPERVGGALYMHGSTSAQETALAATNVSRQIAHDTLEPATRIIDSVRNRHLGRVRANGIPFTQHTRKLDGFESFDQYGQLQATCKWCSCTFPSDPDGVAFREHVHNCVPSPHTFNTLETLIGQTLIPSRLEIEAYVVREAHSCTGNDREAFRSVAMQALSGNTLVEKMPHFHSAWFGDITQIEQIEISTDMMKLFWSKRRGNTPPPPMTRLELAPATLEMLKEDSTVAQGDLVTEDQDFFVRRRFERNEWRADLAGLLGTGSGFFTYPTDQDGLLTAESTCLPSDVTWRNVSFEKLRLGRDQLETQLRVMGKLMPIVDATAAADAAAHAARADVLAFGKTMGGDDVDEATAGAAAARARESSYATTGWLSLLDGATFGFVEVAIATLKANNAIESNTADALEVFATKMQKDHNSECQFWNDALKLTDAVVQEQFGHRIAASYYSCTIASANHPDNVDWLLGLINCWKGADERACLALLGRPSTSGSHAHYINYRGGTELRRGIMKKAYNDGLLVRKFGSITKVRAKLAACVQSSNIVAMQRTHTVAEHILDAMMKALGGGGTVGVDDAHRTLLHARSALAVQRALQSGQSTIGWGLGGSVFVDSHLRWNPDLYSEWPYRMQLAIWTTLLVFYRIRTLRTPNAEGIVPLPIMPGDLVMKTILPLMFG